MQHRVIISSLGKDGKNPKPIYEQVVDNLDVKLVIHAVNSASLAKATEPRIRQRSLRSDAGKSRRTTNPELADASS